MAGPRRQNRQERSTLRMAAMAAAVTLLVASCTRSDQATTTGTVTPASTTTSEATTTGALPSTTTTSTTIPQPAPLAYRQPRQLPAFAPSVEVPLLGDIPAYAGPATPAALDGVLGTDWAPAGGPILDVLVEQGFVVVPDNLRQFQHIYGSGLYEGQTFFVTTDAAYHFVHLAFAKLLRETEQTTLLPILERLLTGLVEGARTQAAEFESTSLADAASRVAQVYEAAAVLAGVDVGPVGPLALEEVALAREHARLAASPTTSFSPCLPTVSPANCVDYGLFTPRGHYTRTAELERYFLAMSLLGQASFFVADPPSLQLGLLAARVLVSEPDLAAAWRLVYEPTAFLVGMADDYTPFELAAAAGDLSDPARFEDLGEVAGVGEALLATRPVGINPEAAAVRIMGARFVIDAFVLDQLTWPNVGTQEKPRVKAVSPLDLAAAYGSELALSIQQAAGNTDYEGFDAQLAAMRILLTDRGAAEWAATVYDAWLYALEPMFAPRGLAFPDFMRTPAWEAKSLQTGLASYTELKHDTILYAKQAIAAEGGVPVPAIPPRHWVEPDPVVFARLAGVVGLAEDGLGARGLLGAPDDERRALLADLHDFLDRLARLAADELAGLPISDADNDWLETIGTTMEAMWLATSDWDFERGAPSADDSDAALIADVFRSSFEVLELGTGRIDRLLVLVPNDQGRFQVAVGGVYSYYEFWQPADRRLNDQEWQDLLDDGRQPDRPAWQQAFLAG